MGRVGRFVESRSDVRQGEPVVVGTRLPVRAVVARIVGGDTIEELVEDYPQVSREAFGAALAVEAGRRLAAAAPGSQVILFGPHVREATSVCGDIAFLVVEPSVGDAAGESFRLSRVLRDLRLSAEILVVSRRYAEDWKDVRGSLVYTAFSHGEVLAG
jgi:uncharacterized protein (DUF433 family)